MVRVADINRGWGLFYSKSCKARWQEKQTGQYKAFINMSERLHDEEIDYEGPGWDAHKDMW